MTAEENTSHMPILHLKLEITKGNIQQEPYTHYLSLSLMIQPEQTALQYQHTKAKCDHRSTAWPVIHPKSPGTGAGSRPQLQDILRLCCGIAILVTDRNMTCLILSRTGLYFCIPPSHCLLSQGKEISLMVDFLFGKNNNRTKERNAISTEEAAISAQPSPA